MIIIDDKGKMALVNRQAEDMFGYARHEMLGKPIEMLIPSRLHEAHVGHRETFLRTPRLRPMGKGRSLVALRNDGSEFPVEISLSPVHAASRRFVSSVIRDVTERKHMEDEIIAARREAERANKAHQEEMKKAKSAFEKERGRLIQTGQRGHEEFLRNTEASTEEKWQKQRTCSSRPLVTYPRPRPNPK